MSYHITCEGVKKDGAYIFQRGFMLPVHCKVGAHKYCNSNYTTKEGKKEEEKKVGIWPRCEIGEDTILESEYFAVLDYN